MADDATTFVFRFEDEGETGPAPRPGDAARARRESRAPGNSSTAPVDRGFQQPRGPGAFQERRQAARGHQNAGDGIRDVLQKIGDVPFVGKFARAADSIIGSLEATVRAINALRFTIGAVNAARGAFGAAQASRENAQRRARDEIIGSRVTPNAPIRPRASQTSPQAPRGPAQRPPGRSPFDNGRVIEVTPRPPGTSLVPSGGNRLPVRRPTPVAVRGNTEAAVRPNAIATRGATSIAAAGAEGAGAEAGAAASSGAALAVGPIALLAVAAAGAALGLRALYSRATRLQTALAGYEGTLAAAQAKRQAQGVLQDIRSARYLGPSLAAQSEAQGRLERSLQRILDVFTKAGLERMTPVLEKIAKVSETVDKFVSDHEKGIGTAVDAVIEGAAVAAGLPPGFARATMDYLRSIDAKTADRRGDMDFFYGFDQLPDLTDEDEGKVHAAPGLKRHAVRFKGLGRAEVRVR